MIQKIKYFIRKHLELPIVIVTKFPYFGFIRETTNYQGSNFSKLFKQKVLNWVAIEEPVHSFENKKNIMASCGKIENMQAKKISDLT